MTKAISTLAILALWPWWVLRACILSAAGVSLIVWRALADEWRRA